MKIFLLINLCSIFLKHCIYFLIITVTNRLFSCKYESNLLEYNLVSKNLPWFRKSCKFTGISIFSTVINLSVTITTFLSTSIFYFSTTVTSSSSSDSHPLTCTRGTLKQELLLYSYSINSIPGDIHTLWKYQKEIKSPCSCQI